MNYEVKEQEKPFHVLPQTLCLQMRLVKHSLCPHLLSLSPPSPQLLCCTWWHGRGLVVSPPQAGHTAEPSGVAPSAVLPGHPHDPSALQVPMCVVCACVCGTWCVCVCNVRGMCALVAQFKDQIPVRGQKNSLSPNLATYGCYCRFASIGNLFNSLENQGTESLNMLPAGIIQNDSHLGFSTLCQAKNCQM